MSGTDKEALIAKAWEIWCNDSFWLFAPYKACDPGTERTLIENPERGKHALRVSYQSGGVTPGDAYVWILDDNYRPVGYKMWVEIIPVKGLCASWENWKDLSGGAKVATYHNIGLFDFNIGIVKSGNYLQSIEVSEDLFARLD